MKKSVKLDAEMTKGGKKNAYIYMATITYKDGRTLATPHATKEGALSHMDILFRNNKVVRHLTNDDNCLFSLFVSVLDDDKVKYYSVDSELLFC